MNVDIRPIRTDADYSAAMREVSAFFDRGPKPGTPDGDRFDILLTLAHISACYSSGYSDLLATGIHPAFPLSWTDASRRRYARFARHRYSCAHNAARCAGSFQTGDAEPC